MKIVLMRHGEPQLHGWPRIEAGRLGEWIEAYNRSDVRDARPPEEAVQASRDCRMIVASGLPRSSGSARLLRSGATPVLSEELFSEASWPFTTVPLLRLKPYAWAAVFRVLWFLGYGRNCGEPAAMLKQRAALAAARLISLAGVHGPVLLVGHGILNTFIAGELLKQGWKGPKLPGYGYWEASEYTK